MRPARWGRGMVTPSEASARGHPWKLAIPTSILNSCSHDPSGCNGSNPSFGIENLSESMTSRDGNDWLTICYGPCRKERPRPIRTPQRKTLSVRSSVLRRPHLLASFTEITTKLPYLPHRDPTKATFTAGRIQRYATGAARDRRSRRAAGGTNPKTTSKRRICTPVSPAVCRR